jgi:predicted MFS family arabinose efflux permease
MLEGIIALFIPITAIVSIALIAVYFRRYNNTERMALIERGINIYEHQPKKKESYDALKAGLFFIGIGLGFLAGYILEANSDMEALAYFVTLFIFGGLGFVASHLVVRKLIKKADQEAVMKQG